MAGDRPALLPQISVQRGGLGRSGSATLTVSLQEFPPRPRIRHRPRRPPIPHSSLGDLLPGALSL